MHKHRISLILSITILGIIVGNVQGQLMISQVYLPLIKTGMGKSDLLLNPDFELGYGGKCRWYHYRIPGTNTNCFDEQDVPQDWTAFWYDQFPCPSSPAYLSGRPEVSIITDIPDPTRIFSGTQAAKMFTFWRCHDMGLLQQVAVQKSNLYQITTMIHSWYSNCSTKPYDPPYRDDANPCIVPWDQDHDYLRVGIDPTGGLDPKSLNIQWSDVTEIYGKYDQRLYSPITQAVSDTITVYIHSLTTGPLKHEDIYIDNVQLLYEGN